MTIKERKHPPGFVLYVDADEIELLVSAWRAQCAAKPPKDRTYTETEMDHVFDAWWE
jgi:hypothetical protein